MEKGTVRNHRFRDPGSGAAAKPSHYPTGTFPLKPDVLANRTPPMNRRFSRLPSIENLQSKICDFQLVSSASVHGLKREQIWEHSHQAARKPRSGKREKPG